MSAAEVYRVTLPPEQILARKLYFCGVEDCGQQFHNASHLQLHQLRRHGLERPSVVASDDANRKAETVVYHCPEFSCCYNERASGDKFFGTFRSLKQHFLKVHAEKNFVCSYCNDQKSFATEALLRAHEENCGETFCCEVCKLSYGTREALLTHAKRKNHGYEALLAKKSSKRKSQKSSKQNAKEPKIETHVTIQIQTNLPIDCSKTTQTTQTDFNAPDVTSRNETSTQTIETLNAPTVDSFCQTNLQQLLNLDESVELGDRAGTTSFSPPPLPLVVCTETQTDLIYDSMFPNEDRTDPMLYSHMYTQTCDDIISDLGLATIETQTSWDGGPMECSSTHTQT
uniref:C2H2-type domain-containing protein n=1 Tax=Culex tarsalis TaxID=7177 RepID=A0A1Q3F159_CULTA